MPPLKKIEGVCPATFALYEDETCRAIDESAQRLHYRKLMEHDIGALVIGGHAGEIASLSAEERAVLIGLAKEEAKGRVPVVGGVVADSTADAVRQTQEQQQAGADAVMVTAPGIPGWRNEVEFLLHHYGAIEEVGIPLVLFGSPSALFGPQYMLSPDMVRTLVDELTSVVAVKITSQWDIGGFMRLTNAIKQVRDIGCLEAGGQAQFAHYVYGADGCLSGGTNFGLGEDVETFKHSKEGRYKEAKELSDSWLGVYNVIYGMEVGLPVVHFHYRYKVVAWLMGIIENPHMRLPQLPPSIEQINMLRDALQSAGKSVTRNDIKPLAVAKI
jgi:4-hydroxy-tetrahydrodipicolinate synthase